jgi:hypothetical protein
VTAGENEAGLQRERLARFALGRDQAAVGYDKFASRCTRAATPARFPGDHTGFIIDSAAFATTPRRINAHAAHDTLLSIGE